jgi:hypothetical protein
VYTVINNSKSENEGHSMEISDADQARFYKKNHKKKSGRLQQVKAGLSVLVSPILMESSSELEHALKLFRDQIDIEIIKHEYQVIEYGKQACEAVASLEHKLNEMVEH